MKTALVTGVTGQDGAYLTRYLVDIGYHVYGAFRRASSTNFWRLTEVGLADHPNVGLVEYDLTDLGATVRLLDRCKPQEVYNLAAQSFVGVSFDQPTTTAQITGLGARCSLSVELDLADLIGLDDWLRKLHSQL